MVKLNIILSTAVALFIIACGSDTDSVNAVNNSNNSNNTSPTPILSAVLTDDAQYTQQRISDDNGLIDITDELIANGYVLAESKSKYVFEIKKFNEEVLPNMDVSFWLDTSNDKINLKVEDPSGNLSTLYQQESITGVLADSAKNKQEVSEQQLVLPLIRLFSIIVRANTIRNLANTALTGFQLFNIYTNYTEIEEQQIYEGTIADFYSIFSTLASIKKIPFVIKRNTKKTDGIITATGLIKFTDNNINYALLEYLQQLTANSELSESDIIKIETIELDGKIEMVTLTLDETNEIDPSSGSFYDININVNGHRDHLFDGTAISVEPELRAVINIGQLAYNTLSGATGYSSEATLSNVPLQQGDEVEVIIYDDDVFSLEEINRFSFIFDGTSQLSENEISTSTLNFIALDGTQQTDNTPKYDVDITIEGDANNNPDEGLTLPDFAGEVFVAGKHYFIDKKNNTLINRQVITNVPINIGDNIRVTIVEEDLLWAPAEIIKFSFEFDGNAVVEENEKVRVTLGF